LTKGSTQNQSLGKAVKDLGKQVKETGSAAKSGKKGTTAGKIGVNTDTGVKAYYEKGKKRK
jgi:hypothetical protein